MAKKTSEAPPQTKSQNEAGPASEPAARPSRQAQQAARLRPSRPAKGSPICQHPAGPRGSVLVAFALGVALTSAGAAQQSAPAAAGDDSFRLQLKLRYRLEGVDQANLARDALASTLRTELSLSTPAERRLRVGLTLEDTSSLQAHELFNNAGAGSLANRVTDRPVVADPDQTSILEAFAEVSLSSKLELRAGRTRIRVGDERFVGAVAWRQHHQSFDVARLELQTGPWSATYAYLDRVHRITGLDLPLETHLALASRKIQTHEVVLLGLFLDGGSRPGSLPASSTVGIRSHGAHALSDSKLLYELQLATQDARSHSNDYLALDAGWSRGGWTLRGRQERLQGNGVTAFATPLATLHKFNGWADQFLTTPPNGLVDTSIRVDVGRDGWSASLRFHDFQSEMASIDYGTELDLLITVKTDFAQLGLKAARYEADQHRVDTTKVMLFASRSFDWTFGSTGGS